MSLSMQGHIDPVFKSVDAVRIKRAQGGYVEGLYVEGQETRVPHTVTIQPLSDKELRFLDMGGERVGDLRKIYVNSGDLQSITLLDQWRFDTITGLFKTIKLDNRYWRDYCKIIVSKIDE